MGVDGSGSILIRYKKEVRDEVLWRWLEGMPVRFGVSWEVSVSSSDDDDDDDDNG